MMTPRQKQNAIEAILLALDAIKESPTTTPCVDCMNFNNGFCAKWKNEVPVEFQAAGCEKFHYEFDVPF